MKIRLTKETLGLPEGTVIEHSKSRQGSEGAVALGSNIDYSDPYIWIPGDHWEEIPEPTEEDRLRADASILRQIIEEQKSLISALSKQLQETQATQKPAEPRYRMLEEGELIRSGDQQIGKDGEWRNLFVHPDGSQVLAGDRLGRCRRRLPDGI